VNFFLQLATQRLLRCKMQERLLRVTWPLVMCTVRKQCILLCYSNKIIKKKQTNEKKTIRIAGLRRCTLIRIQTQNKYDTRLKKEKSIALGIPTAHNLRVIRACALKNGGFFFAAEPRQRGKSSFSRKRAW